MLATVLLREEDKFFEEEYTTEYGFCRVAGVNREQ